MLNILYLTEADQVRPAPSRITPIDIGFEYENISFSSRNAIELSGWYIPSENGAVVILLHGYGDNRVGMLEQAKILAQHGYGVLLYDLRAHGESDGEMRTYGWIDPEDVKAALTFLETRDEINTGKIGIFGFSIGGQITLRAVRIPVKSSSDSVLYRPLWNENKTGKSIIH